VSDALATGLIGLGGVALGLLGNAGIEWVKRTASRRDAAAERQAAILRELQEVLDEYLRQWAELYRAIGHGEASLRTLPLTSGPSQVNMRYRALLESVSDDDLRGDLSKFRSEVVARVAESEGAPTIATLGVRLGELHGHIGAVLRRISA
jgi:hypothetical protein